MNKKSQINIFNIYAIITIGALLIASDTIYAIRIYVELDDILKLFSLILTLLPVGFFMVKRNENYFNRYTGGSVVIFLLMLIWSVVNTMPIKSTIGIWIRFFGILCFAIWCNRRDINYLYYTYKIIIGISVLCLLFWIFFDMKFLGIDGVECFLETSKEPFYSYLGIYYKWGKQFQRKILGLNVYSTNGIWSEPGAYQMFPTFALLYGLFVNKNTKKYELFILSLAVISSVSGMGLLILVLLWGIKIISIVMSKVRHKLIFVLTVGAGIFGVLVMLVYEKMQTTNWGSRMGNMLEMIEKVCVSPFWGIGMSKDIWSGLFNYFINYGILGIIPFFCILYGIRNQFWGKNVYAYAGLGVWWFLSLLNEPLGYNSVIYILYAACLLCKDKNMMGADISCTASES